MEQPNKEILRQRLFKELQLTAFDWLIPVIFAGITFLFPLRAFPHMDVVRKVASLFWPSLPLLFGYQVIVWLWIYKLRKTLETATPSQAKVCYIGNIIFGVGSFILLPILGIVGNNLIFCGGPLIAVLLFLPLSKVNRLIKVLYLQQYPSREEYECSSPCPEIFRLWHINKSMIFTPLAGIGITLIIYSASCLFPRESTPSILLKVFTIGILFSIPVCFLMSVFFLPYWFIKQTATPSPWQRQLRAWFSDMQFLGSATYPPEELVAFKWWLSHPNQPWPKNMQELCRYIETYKFDWQDLSAWEIPLENARKNLAHDKTSPFQVSIPLQIGEQADQFKKEIIFKPTEKISPFLQAIMDNDLSRTQALLSAANLNRPFAETGNTPLHIAALNGYTEIVRLLLAQPDIDTTLSNNNGKTALDLAQEKGFEEIAQLLEKK